MKLKIPNFIAFPFYKNLSNKNFINYSFESYLLNEDQFI